MAGALNVSKEDVEKGETTSATHKEVVDKTFARVAKLVKLLPTATVLAFQTLSPPFTNGGHCFTVNKYCTGMLLGFCGLSCFFASFTDSYRGDDGKIYYGIVTKTGLWTLDANINKTVDLSSYRRKFVDFVHAVFSVLVFAAVALMDTDVINCFYPAVNDKAKALLMSLPVGVGFVSSLVFLVFPTKRHGIGYPAN